LNATGGSLYNNGYNTQKPTDMLCYISDPEIERFIKEDIPYGDLTARLPVRKAGGEDHLSSHEELTV